MRHTPGPWKADPSSWGGRHRISGNHVAVGEAVTYDDARLMAAAPRMLAALKTVRDAPAGAEAWRAVMVAVNLTIAEAEGQP